MSSNTLYLLLFVLGSLCGVIFGINFRDPNVWDSLATFVECFLYFTFSSAILSVLLHAIVKSGPSLRLLSATLIGGFVGTVAGVICVTFVGLLLRYDYDWKLHLPLSVVMPSLTSLIWGSCFVAVGMCRPSASETNAVPNKDQDSAARRDFAE